MHCSENNRKTTADWSATPTDRRYICIIFVPPSRYTTTSTATFSSLIPYFFYTSRYKYPHHLYLLVNAPIYAIQTNFHCYFYH